MSVHIPAKPGLWDLIFGNEIWHLSCMVGTLWGALLCFHCAGFKTINLSLCLRVCACVRAFVRARAWVRASVRACVHARARVHARVRACVRTVHVCCSACFSFPAYFNKSCLKHAVLAQTVRQRPITQPGHHVSHYMRIVDRCL